MSKKRNIGLLPRARRFLFGGVREPKVKSHDFIQLAGTDKKNLDQIQPEDYRHFRRDELTRRCIVINAMIATFTAGFETELELVGEHDPNKEEELLKKYAFVKDYVDACNKKVNMDKVLFTSQVKRGVFGSCGWEIVSEADGKPMKFISLVSNKLKPEVESDWTLKGFEYDGTKGKYKPEEVLYFENLQLEQRDPEHRGLSDIEPIRDVCNARHDMLRQNLPEIAKTAWAPTILLQVDRNALDGLTEAEEDTLLQSLADAVRPGKVTAFPDTVVPTVVERKINMTGLIDMLNKFDEAIMRNFGTPAFLLSQNVPNRAVAFAQLEAYVQGPIANIQKYFKRELEALWYDMLTRQALKMNGDQSGELPVCVKHKWNPVRATDIYEMGKTVAQLYAGGAGILAEPTFWPIVFDMMGWNKDVLEEWKESFEPPEEEKTET